MELIQNLILEGELVTIDDKHFVDCTFIDCILEYRGQAVSFERTQMSGCRYVFFGHARSTVHFLQGAGLMPYTPGEWGEFPDMIH